MKCRKKTDDSNDEIIVKMTPKGTYLKQSKCINCRTNKSTFINKIDGKKLLQNDDSISSDEEILEINSL